jgi:hypothetical protein
VEGRDGNLVAAHFRRAFNHFRQALEHLGIGLAAIDVRVLLALPQADGDRVLAVWADKRDLIGEAVLLLKQGQDVLLKGLDELFPLGLQIEKETCRAYIGPPWDMIAIVWFTING